MRLEVTAWVLSTVVYGHHKVYGLVHGAVERRCPCNCEA